MSTQCPRYYLIFLFILFDFIFTSYNYLVDFFLPFNQYCFILLLIIDMISFLGYIFLSKRLNYISFAFPGCSMQLYFSCYIAYHFNSEFLSVHSFLIFLSLYFPSTSQDNYTPLILASKNGHVEAVKRLCEAGRANVDLKAGWVSI